MINALTEKLGEETIFGIVQNQMYHAEDDTKHERQLTSNQARNFSQIGVPFGQGHAYAINETRTTNVDQVAFVLH